MIRFHYFLLEIFPQQQKNWPELRFHHLTRPASFRCYLNLTIAALRLDLDRFDLPSVAQLYIVAPVVPHS